MSIDLGSGHICDFYTPQKYRSRKVSLITTITGKSLVEGIYCQWRKVSHLITYESICVPFSN